MRLGRADLREFAAKIRARSNLAARVLIISLRSTPARMDGAPPVVLHAAELGASAGPANAVKRGALLDFRETSLREAGAKPARPPPL